MIVGIKTYQDNDPIIIVRINQNKFNYFIKFHLTNLIVELRNIVLVKNKLLDTMGVVII